MLKKFFVVFCVLTSFLSARIVETPHICEILKEIDQDTFVLFDIDETTLTTTTTLGSSVWWDYFVKKLAPVKEEKKQIFPIVYKVIRAVPSKTVELETAALIRSLQERNITVIALTSRCKRASWDFHFAEYTRDQLKSLDIDFERSTWPAEIHFSLCNTLSHYAYGIIFTNFESKGPVLVKVLKELNYRPKKIVMVENLRPHIQSVEDSLSKENIPFVGFRYSHLDHCVSQFDPMIGNIQLRALLTQDQILTDEEAALIKKELFRENPHLHPDFYLNELFTLDSQI